MPKVLGAVVVVGALILIWWSTTKDEVMENSEKMSDESLMMESSQAMSEAAAEETRAMDEPMAGESAMMEKSGGKYLEYSPERFSGESGKRRVLFFYASWCPFCRPADADFREKIGELPSDVSVIRVNYNDPDTDDEEKALAKKYGVTYQHTFVQIDTDGQVVTSWNGGKTAELLKNIK